MSYLDNLETRLNYRGGAKQHDRMVADKLWSLRSAINHAYQTVTLETQDGKAFRCLLNPDNLKPDYDMKILSIPYQCVDMNAPKVGTTTQGLVDIGLKPGDVFTWSEDGSKWIIYMQYKQELAYFRAECRKCEGIADVNGHPYDVYVRGPVETKINWLSKDGLSLNNPNYSLEVYITKNEETSEFFHRFKEVKIDGLPYQVQAIDWYAGDGIIQLVLLEYFKTTIADEAKKVEPVIPPQETKIIGEQHVYPYDIKSYEIKSEQVGKWTIDNKKAKILESSPTSVTLEVVTGKSGKFNLSYIVDNIAIDTVEITIDPM